MMLLTSNVCTLVLVTTSAEAGAEVVVVVVVVDVVVVVLASNVAMVSFGIIFGVAPLLTCS